MTQPTSAIRTDRGNGRTGGDGGAEGGEMSMRDPQEQITFSAEEIAERAYKIYERGGRSDGHDLDHWLQAERELREERAREQGRSPNQQLGQQSNSSGTRSQRPDEAPRSARRHQAAMNQ